MRQLAEKCMHGGLTSGCGVRVGYRHGPKLTLRVDSDLGVRCSSIRRSGLRFLRRHGRTCIRWTDCPGQCLIDADELLQAIHVYELIDVLVGIGIRGGILVLHLCHQQRKKIIGRNAGR